jgi:thioredoxin 1
MSSVLHVQQGEWMPLETSDKPLFVDFWAEWCTPCRMLGPTFEKLAEKYGNEITFVKVNVDDLPDVAGKYGVRSIPTLLLLRQGNVLEQVVGTRSYNELVRILDRHMAPTVKG